jgi:hypothetical protein
VIVADADRPSLEAEITALPAATAVTRPELDTDAALGLLELQTTVRSTRALPFASRIAAVSCVVPPATIDAVAGDTETDATGIGAGGVTVNCEELVTPSLLALICALPGPTACI